MFSLGVSVEPECVAVAGSQVDCPPDGVAGDDVVWEGYSEVGVVAELAVAEPLWPQRRWRTLAIGLPESVRPRVRGRDVCADCCGPGGGETDVEDAGGI